MRWHSGPWRRNELRYYMLLYLLEVIFLIGIVWFVVTQITLPAFRGSAFFPIFKRKELEDRLAEAKEELGRAETENRIKTEWRKVRQIRNPLSRIK